MPYKYHPYELLEQSEYKDAPFNKLYEELATISSYALGMCDQIIYWAVINFYENSDANEAKEKEAAENLRFCAKELDKAYGDAICILAAFEKRIPEIQECLKKYKENESWPEAKKKAKPHEYNNTRRELLKKLEYLFKPQWAIVEKLVDKAFNTELYEVFCELNIVQVMIHTEIDTNAAIEEEKENV